ncbi:MAG: hypothetical protein IBJ09_12985 [Bacteroidia bacterium]|nr:hypothetical protein [Bacteroidia bacterium]
MLEAGFLSIVAVTFILFCYGSGNARKVLFVFIPWALFCGVLSYTGFFRDTDVMPPRFLLVLLPVIAIVVYLYRSLDVSRIRPAALLALHTVRIPVELVLYRLYLAGSIPRGMTFEGWNFDILSGITALVLLLYFLLRKTQPGGMLFRLWNIAGVVLLAIIVVTAILSSPLPVQAFAFEQPNRAILEFPYTLLPAVVVPMVLLSHLLCLKKQV